MAVLCPVKKCGRKFINQECAEIHADAEHDDWRTPRQKGWATPYGFGDFKQPVTYAEACEQMKQQSEEFAEAMKAGGR